MPSLEVITGVVASSDAATATNSPSPKQTLLHERDCVADRDVHSMPLLEVITWLLPLDETATNVPFPNVTLRQEFWAAADRGVHTSPAGGPSLTTRPEKNPALHLMPKCRRREATNRRRS